MGELVDISDHLRGKRQEALLLMARGLSCKQVSDQTGIPIQTLYNWRSSESTFRAELARLQRALYAEGVGALCGLVRQAAESLAGVMNDSAAKDGDRIAAARTVLQFAMTSRTGSPVEVDQEDAEFRSIATELAQLVRAAGVG